jgi:hypothetical protein
MNDPDRRQTSDGFDHDAMFADIVAHWNEAAAEPTGVPKPADEDAPAGEGSADPSELEPTEDSAIDAATVDDERAALPSPSPPMAIPAPQAWRAHEVDDEYEEHFEPPPVAPLPVGDLQFWAIIAGMGGGPLLLLYLVLFNRDASSYWMLTAVAMSVGGFALLVARLPRDHADDGDDNGARL